MAKLTTKARQKLSSSSFALPGKGTGKGGKGAGSYPIPDKSHARNALARVSQHGSSSEKATVRAKVHRKFPDIGKKQMGGVAPRLGGPPRGVLGRPPRPGLGGPPRPGLGGPPRVGLGGPPRPVLGGAPRPVLGGARPRIAYKKGGVASFPKPHTYAGGGVAKGRSGDSSPATCGKMKGHSGFAELGIRK